MAHQVRQEEDGTLQDADQDQWGRKGKDCGCHGTGIQAIGQEAKSEQGALAASLAVQAFGHGKCRCTSGGNSNAPVGVGGYGSGGGYNAGGGAGAGAAAGGGGSFGDDPWASGGGAGGGSRQQPANDPWASAQSEEPPF